VKGPRLETEAGKLARLGFTDAAASQAAMTRLDQYAEPLLHLLAATADPDLAVRQLAELADRVDERDTFLTALSSDEGSAMRLLCVLGASSAVAIAMRTQTIVAASSPAIPRWGSSATSTSRPKA